MLERYIKRPFFLEKGLSFFLYKHEKKEKTSQKSDI